MEVRFLRPKDVERMFGIRVKTLANLRWLKKGPPYKKLGRTVLYEPDKVERWIKKHCAEGR